MSFSVTFFLNGGLFDFDLTFVAEATLFLLLSLVVTFIFLAPISKQIDERFKNLDPEIVADIKSNILEQSLNLCWEDIAGLQFAK